MAAIALKKNQNKTSAEPGGCQFEEDRPEISQFICKTWPGIPAAAIEALLVKLVPFQLEGETLVFEHEDQGHDQ